MPDAADVKGPSTAARSLLEYEPRGFPRAHSSDPPTEEVIQQMRSTDIAVLVRTDAIRAEAGSA